MISFNLKDLSVAQVHHHLLSAIGPRPICFASTVDKAGSRNLAPFSFFNVFSANPPILVFSPARSGRTGQTKDTHENVKEVPEVVVNVVTYAMAEQVNLASSPYPKGIDEFKKAGFTPLNSDLIQPSRVKESPVQLECKVIEIKELGEQGAAGNLIICEVLRMHISESVLDHQGLIDQEKIDTVARMGGSWYSRAHGSALFKLEKMLARIGVGVDGLPEHIRNSEQITGKELGLLGSLDKIPNQEEIDSQVSKLQSQEITLDGARIELTRGDLTKAFILFNHCLQQ